MCTRAWNDISGYGYGYRVMTGRDPGQTCKPIFRNRYGSSVPPLLSRPTVRHAEYIDGVWDRCDAYRVWTSIFSTICIKSKSRGSSNDIVIAPSCAGFLFVRDDFFFFFYLVRLVVRSSSPQPIVALPNHLSGMSTPTSLSVFIKVAEDLGQEI